MGTVLTSPRGDIIKEFQHTIYCSCCGSRDQFPNANFFVQFWRTCQGSEQFADAMRDAV
jgi:hypothetical protein